MKTQIDVRIDTETPGAKIRYGVVNKSSNTADWGWTWTDGNNTSMNTFLNTQNNSNNENVKNSTLAADPNGNQRGVVSQSEDADIADLTGLSLSFSYDNTGPFLVGDDIIMTARKDYVAAQASRSGEFTEDDVSGRGYEGVFKTAVFFQGRYRGILTNGPTGNNNIGMPVIQGNSQATGISVISGFPLKDNPVANEDGRNEFQMFSKHMYFAGPTTGNPTDAQRRWVWISWEIITDWWEISCIDVTLNTNGNNTRSFQNNGGGTYSQYNQGSYGNFIYRQNQR
jgi:hypothetical protein